MRKQRKQREQAQCRSGQSDNIRILRLLNTSTLILISLYSLIQGLKQHRSITDIIFYCGSMLIFAIIIILIKNPNSLYIVYIFIGITTIICETTTSGYSGFIYFIFASGIFKEYKYTIVSFVLSFISLSIRLSILSAATPVSIQMLLVFCFLFYTFHLMFLKQPKKRIDLWKEISEKEKAILKLFMRGKDYAQISHILNLTDKKESIRTIITRCRTKSGCDNDIQFGIWLSDKG